MRYFFILIFVSVFTVAYTQTFVPIDAASKISFKIKNFGSTVDGRFEGLKGTIKFDESSLLAAQFNVTIDAATVDTGIRMRDNHLRKPDYFGASAFPIVHFVSTKVTPSSKANQGIVTGKLTIKKTTKEISFPFRYSVNKGVPEFVGEFQIDRREFDVGGYSISLADELKVMLDVKTGK